MTNINKVSILLPVFNGERYVVTAIESVLNQTYENIELVVCDNCSTDSTYEIVQDLSRRDQRIKLSRNDKNVGVMPNFNRCIETSTGDYLEIFGHDDILELACIEKLVEVLDNQPNVVVATAARNWIDAEGKLIEVSRQFEGSRLLPGDEAIRSCMESLDNWISAPAMFRSENKGRGFNPRMLMYSDLDYWFRMFTHGDLFYLDEVVFNYRLHQGEGTVNFMKEMSFAVDVLRLIDRYGMYLSKTDSSPAYMRKRAQTKLCEFADHIVHERGINFENLLKPCDVDVSNFDLNETDALRLDMHDYRRAAVHGLVGAADAAEQLRAHQAEIAKYQHYHNVDAEEQKKLKQQVEQLTAELDSIKGSTSWKLTSMLRNTAAAMRPGGRGAN